MSTAEPIRRQAARLLVINSDSRVLLLEGFDPAEPAARFWFTIGGGIDDGEEPAQAALRELREEAGIKAAADELSGPFWQRSTEFSFDGIRYRQDEVYFLLRVGLVEVSLAGLDEIEQQTVTRHRWWSRDELITTREIYFPAELPDLLGQLPAAPGGSATRRPRRPS